MRVIEAGRKALVPPLVQAQVSRDWTLHDHARELAVLQKAPLAGVELLEVPQPGGVKVTDQELLLEPAWKIRQGLLKGVAIRPQHRLKVLDPHGVVHHVDALMHLLLALLGVQEAHDAEEARELEEFILVHDAVRARGEDRQEAPAVLPVHCVGLRQAELHNDRYQVRGSEVAKPANVELGKALPAACNKVLAREVLHQS
mmetsp:Transcript_2705/g.7272  ORF Transcript_2705/g.7272 Transcript_2705/m.7272 type:complete len:200 (+) Transcript_2705:487-1086(+)